MIHESDKLSWRDVESATQAGPVKIPNDVFPQTTSYVSWSFSSSQRALPKLEFVFFVRPRNPSNVSKMILCHIMKIILQRTLPSEATFERIHSASWYQDLMYCSSYTSAWQYTSALRKKGFFKYLLVKTTNYSASRKRFSFQYLRT